MRPARGFGRSADERQVVLVCSPGGSVFLHGGVHLWRQRDDDEPGCVLVEAGQDAGLGSAIAHVPQDGIEQRPRAVLVGGVDDNAWRFVDDEYRVVLVDDGQRTLFRLRSAAEICVV